MELGKTIGIKIIKLENKYSIKEIDDILYNVNDMLYFFANKYINTDAKEYIKERLSEYGKSLSSVSTNGDRTARKKELLDKMREIYKAVNCLAPDNDQRQIENMSKFVMAMFVKNKDTMTEEDIFKLMKDNVLFTKIYGYNERIASIQKDLLKKFAILNE